MSQLISLYRLDEMARSREDAMWAVLDWAATQPGEFTIKDMYRVWAAAGGGGDSASYQQFSTAINNYIYKFDPQSPVAKYRNPRYKFIRVGKTDKGTAPAPLQFVTRGQRGAGAQHVLRWRTGIAPMRQPAGPKKPLAPEGDPVGDVLDRLERKLGRPALKAAMQRWKQLGDLHKISADIMADQQIRGRDKMLALQVAADSLVSRGKASKQEVDRAEDEMGDEVEPETPFSAGPEPTGFEDDEDQKTDPDATPLGSQVGPPSDGAPDDGDGSEDAEASGGPEEPGEDGGDKDSEEGSPPGASLPVLLRKGGTLVKGKFTWGGGGWEDGQGTVTDATGKRYSPRDGWEIQVQGSEFYDEKYEAMLLWLSEAWGDLNKDPESEGGPSLSGGGSKGHDVADDDEVAPESPADTGGDGGPSPDDDTMRGTLVGTEEGGNDGTRIPVTIRYDDEDGATVEREGGDQVGPYEGFNLEVANGVLTQDAFDDLEEDGWSLVAAEEAQADDSEQDADEDDDDDAGEDDGGSDEGDEPLERQGSIKASGGREYPAYLPDPDEEGDKSERAMFELVSDEDDGIPASSPFWESLRQARDSVDAHRIIKASGLPHGLHKYALTVARAIFDNTGRDFDSGKKKNESRLTSVYGIIETPLVEPVDFEQRDGLSRVFKWAGRSR